MMTAKQNKVRDFEGIDHGIDNPQYFQGCGTAFTSFEHVATGCGDNPREALEDALEQIAMGENNVDTDNLKRRLLREYNNGKELPELPSAHAELMKANGFDEDAEFQDDDLDDAEPERDDYDSEEAYNKAFEEWEAEYAEAQEAHEQAAEEFSDGVDGNYYYYSIRYNV